MTRTVARHQTALNRFELSKPVRLALDAELIDQNTIVLDYGCGKGSDVQLLKKRGIKCFGWDPFYFPKTKQMEADVVNLGYVINVIEDPGERNHALKKAWELTKKVLIISARHNLEARNELLPNYGDGYLTKRNTFQKHYHQHELRNWIDKVLQVESLPTAPGIFYAFRDLQVKQTYLASRYRRRSSVPRQSQSNLIFEKHKSLFEQLMGFIAFRGRLPEDWELKESLTIRKELGSLKRAYRIILRVTGAEKWEEIK